MSKPVAMKIPNELWETHQKEICDLYLDEGMTLSKIRGHMVAKYGFSATKPQYVRKLKAWGIEKNVNSDTWKHVADLVDRRDAAGKDTIIIIGEREVSAKRLRKEMGRSSIRTRAIGSEYIPAMDVKAFTPPSASGLDPPVFGFSPVPMPLIINFPFLEFQNFIMQFASCLSRFQKPNTIAVTENTAILSANGLPNQVAPTAPFTLPSTVLEIIAAGADNCNRQAVKSEPWLVYLNSIIYMVSNSFLTETQMDDLVRHIYKDQNNQAITELISAKQQSLSVFATKFLPSAVRLGKNDLVQALLLNDGIQPNATTCDGGMRRLSSALVIAANQGDIRLVDVLLQAGADPNNSGNKYSKFTILDSLMQGRKHKHCLLSSSEKQTMKAIIMRLLDSGGRISSIDSLTSFMRAHLARGYETQLGQRLLNSLIRPSDDSGYNRETSRLISAVKSCDFDEIKTLISDGADVNGVGIDWNSFDPSNRDTFHAILIMRSPLVAAIELGSTQMVSLLLNNGADPNSMPWEIFETESRAESPLNTAVIRHRNDITQLLLRHGADPLIDTLDSIFVDLNRFQHSNTDMDTVELLLRYSISLEMSTDRRERVLSIFYKAISRPHATELAKLLIGYDSILKIDPCTEGRILFRAALKSNFLETIKLIFLRCPLWVRSNQDTLQASLAITALGAQHRTLRKEQADKELMCRFLLASGASVDGVVSPENRTALETAINLGCLRLTKLYLKLGADISSVRGFYSDSKWGHSSDEDQDDEDQEDADQDYTDSTHDAELLLYLVENGLNLDGYCVRNMTITPLQAVLKWGNLDFAILLLNEGANPLAVSPHCAQPLHLVLKNSNEVLVVQILHRLLSLNVDVHVREHIKTKALLECMRSNFRGFEDRIEEFLADPVQIASRYGHRRAIKILHAAGANINTPAPPAFGFTALQILILSKGAHRRCFDEDAWSRRNEFDSCDRWKAAFEVLIEFGAEVNAPASTQVGCTALQAAILTNDDVLTRRLLELGADINAPCSSEVGYTALQAAIISNDEKLARELIEAGADINASAASEVGKTALQAAVSVGNGQLARFLLNLGANIHDPPCRLAGATALQYAAIIGDLDLVVDLLKMGAYINADAAPVDGRTALQGAAEHGRLDIIGLLLENDSDWENLPVRCNSAANFAENEGHYAIAKMLRERGGTAMQPSDIDLTEDVDDVFTNYYLDGNAFVNIERDIIDQGFDRSDAALELMSLKE